MVEFNKEEIKKINICPGIYYIKNKINGKGYVGKSLKLRQRLYEHYYQNTDKDKVLYKAFKKYGLNNFEFTILQYIEEETKDIKYLNAVLSDLEIYYIDKYNTFKYGYNLTLGGEGALGRVFTEEEREVIRQRYLNDSALLKHSQECKCITYSYNLISSEIKTFNSRKEAANYLIQLGYKSSDTQVVKVVNGTIKQHHNHIFANSLEELNSKVKLYKNNKATPKTKIDYEKFYNQLIKYADEYGVLPIMDELEKLLDMPKTNISKRISKLQSIDKLTKITIMSRQRIALANVNKELFITKVKLTNLETGEISVMTDEECAKLLQYKPNTIKNARTNHSIIKNYLLESCCLYNVVQELGIDSVTGIFKKFDKNG